MLICLSTISEDIRAQSGIGFHIGKCYSNFHVVEGDVKFYDFSNDFDHKGIKTELYYSYSFNKYVRLRPSLGYIKRGVIVKRSPSVFDVNNFTLEYWDISVNADFSPVKYFMISCGLNNNYLIKETNYYGKSGVSDGTEFYEKFDFGYKLGATFTIKNIFINASYFKSIKPARVIDFVSTLFPGSKNTEYRNRSLEFSIGYHFNFKKRKKDKSS